MKSLFIISLACLAVLVCFSNSGYAQKQLQDSLWAFSEPLQLETGGKELMGRRELKFKIKTPSQPKLAIFCEFK